MLLKALHLTLVQVGRRREERLRVRGSFDGFSLRSSSNRGKRSQEE